MKPITALAVSIGVLSVAAIVAISLIIGNLFGLVSEKLAGALVASGD